MRKGKRNEAKSLKVLWLPQLAVTPILNKKQKEKKKRKKCKCHFKVINHVNNVIGIIIPPRNPPCTVRAIYKRQDNPLQLYLCMVDTLLIFVQLYQIDLLNLSRITKSDFCKQSCALWHRFPDKEQA